MLANWTVKYLIYFAEEKQLMVLSFMIVGRAVGVGFTVLLLIGVKKVRKMYFIIFIAYFILT